MEARLQIALNIYEATSEQEAVDRYFAFIGHLPPALQEAFIPLQLTMEEWGEYIFNYWSVPRRLTNGFVEAKNRCIRDANRAGYGLSLRTLRAKMLFSSSDPAPLPPTQKPRKLRLQPQEALVL